MKQKLLTLLGYLCLAAICKTNKFVITGEENLKIAIQNKRSILLCVWHGRMLYPIFYVIKNKIKSWAIASKHKDGEIMGNILSKWKIKLIKGSSNKDGHSVLSKMESVFSMDAPQIIAITNDGPKGPRHKAKINSLAIAIKNNVQIITITGNASKKWVFNTWDVFHLPKPFGTIYIHISPIFNYTKSARLSEQIAQYLIAAENIVDKKI